MKTLLVLTFTVSLGILSFCLATGRYEIALASAINCASLVIVMIQAGFLRRRRTFTVDLQGFQYGIPADETPLNIKGFSVKVSPANTIHP